MEAERYVYRIKPLVIPGLTFLFIYPLVIGIIYLIIGITNLELKILIGIYTVTLITLVGFWIFGKSKSLGFRGDQIEIYSIMGKNIIKANNIKKLVIFWMPNGKEVVQIKTLKNNFYLSDLYFPFPELMSDLESFARANDIKLVEIAKSA